MKHSVFISGQKNNCCMGTWTPSIVPGFKKKLMIYDFISFVVLTSLLYIRIIYHCYGLNSQAHERLRVETSP